MVLITQVLAMVLTVEELELMIWKALELAMMV